MAHLSTFKRGKSKLTSTGNFIASVRLPSLACRAPAILLQPRLELSARSTATYAAAALSTAHAASSDAFRPSPGFSRIEDAIAAVRSGEFVLVLDDEDRENEGDLIIAADKATPQQIAYMVEYTSGVLCVGLPKSETDRLGLPLMVPTTENEESMYTAFTVTVDLRDGITTGISATDRCATIRALGSPATTAAQLRKPGHIFPLIAREHGVLKRPGHTEASVDLARLAGCHPAGVLCEVVDKTTGDMAQTEQLLKMAAAHSIHCVTIKDLIRYRVQHEPLTAAVTQDVRVGGVAAQALECVDGSKAVYGAVGDVSKGRPHVFVFEVPCPEGATWGDAAARLHEDAVAGPTVRARAADGDPFIFVVSLVRRSSTEGTQGAALPGMQLAALMAAVKGAACAQQLQVANASLQASLAQFGYDVEVA